MDKDKDKDFKNKEKLIRAALEEFGIHSFREASLNNIIKKAGVSKGSFYFHFKDKKSLYFYLFDEITRLKVEFLKKHTSGELKDTGDKDFFELLKISAEGGIRFALEYPEYQGLASNYLREKGNRIYDEIKERFSGDFTDIIRPEIERALKEGKFRKGMDGDFIIRIINYLLLNFDVVFPYEERNSQENILALFDKYIDFIKFGLVRKSRKGY